jgi:ankyrin repeat protein
LLIWFQRFKSSTFQSATIRGQTKVASYLINHGLTMKNETNYRGRTSLHAAVFQNNPEIVRQLVDAGAKTKIKDVNKETALHIAYPQKNPDILYSLVCYDLRKMFN